MTATLSATAPPTLPTDDVDPFGHEVLEDPLPMHAALRDAGPGRPPDAVRRLRARPLRAGARRARRLAGVPVRRRRRAVELPRPRSRGGRRACCWRPTRPRHDAPRRVLQKVLSPRSLRRLRDGWLADAEALVDEVLAEGTGVRRRAAPGRGVPAAGVPGRRRPRPTDGRENLLPYGDHAFNAFGPANDLVAKGAPRVAELSAWVAAQCPRDALAPEGFGADIWAASDRGDITPEQAPLLVRSLLTAGVDTTVHGISAVLYAFATNPDQWQRLRARARAWPASRSTRRCAGSRRCRRSSAPRPPTSGSATHVVPEGTQDPHVPRRSANRDPRRWDDPDAFDLSRDPSGHVGFGMGIHQCVGQHVARLEAEALLTALARRVAHHRARRADDAAPQQHAARVGGHPGCGVVPA